MFAIIRDAMKKTLAAFLVAAISLGIFASIALADGQNINSGGTTGGGTVGGATGLTQRQQIIQQTLPLLSTFASQLSIIQQRRANENQQLLQASVQLGAVANSLNALRNSTTTVTASSTVIINAQNVISNITSLATSIQNRRTQEERILVQIVDKLRQLVAAIAALPA